MFSGSGAIAGYVYTDIQKLSKTTNLSSGYTKTDISTENSESVFVQPMPTSESKSKCLKCELKNRSSAMHPVNQSYSLKTHNA